jgi:hypothetical protein
MGKVGLMVNSFIAAHTSAPYSMEMAVEIIQKSMEFSKGKWAALYHAELSEHGSRPDAYPFFKGQLEFDMSPTDLDRARCEPDYYETQAAKVLNAIWLGTYVASEGNEFRNAWNYYKRWLLQNNPPFHRETLLLLAAFVSCGLGISV